MEEKLKQILSNEEIVKVLNAQESKEDLRKKLSEYGIDFSEEELDVFIDEMNKVSQEDSENTEFAEQDLDDVSGGVGVTSWVVITTAVSWSAKVVKYCWNAGRWVAKRF